MRVTDYNTHATTRISLGTSHLSITKDPSLQFPIVVGFTPLTTEINGTLMAAVTNLVAVVNYKALADTAECFIKVNAQLELPV